MRFPATPGWVSPPVVVGAPRHSWLRAPGAVHRHSWLGSAGGGGVWPLATPGCGSWLQFPATPGWGVRWWRWWVGPCHSWLRISCAVPRHSWLGSAGRGSGRFRGWGFPVLCVLVARRGRVVSVLVCVVCVGRVCVGGGAGVGVPSACVCVCVCVCVCGVLVACGFRSLLPPGVAGVGGGVAGVCCGWSLATPSGGSCVRLPATPSLVSLPVVVDVPRLSWLRAPGAVPRHSWLGSAGGGGVRLPATPGRGLPVAVRCFVGRGVPCCVCLWSVWLRAVALLCCVLRVCGVRFVGGVVWLCGVGVSSVCAGVRGCVCVVCRWSVVCCPRLFWLGLAAGVCVGVVGVCCGSPATSGCETWVLCPATPDWGPPLCGGGWSLATPGCGVWLRGPATPG